MEGPTEPSGTHVTHSVRASGVQRSHLRGFACWEFSRREPPTIGSGDYLGRVKQIQSDHDVTAPARLWQYLRERSAVEER
jgi:hypothetical protein